MNLLKEEIREALLRQDFEKVVCLAVGDKKVFRVLISLTYDKESVLCWRAAEAMGKAAGAVAEKDPETVRTIVQRLIWSVREESGGIGWSAPEMLGEIVINSPRICADIPPIILSFHEEESFLKGVLWAMGRIVRSGPGEVEGLYEVAREALEHRDPSVRGLALWAIPAARLGEAADKVKRMMQDEGRLGLYENGELVEMRVGDIACKVLNEGRRRAGIEA